MAMKHNPRRKVVLEFPNPSKTHQSFKDECDINRIVARYQKTGLLPQVNSQPQYGDFCTSDDYQTSMNKVLHAQNSFMSLPAKVRARFENDPAKFLDFVYDPENAQELVSLGLATKRDDVDSLESKVDTDLAEKAKEGAA